MVIQSEKWLLKYKIGCSNQSWLFKPKLVVQKKNGCSMQMWLFKTNLVIQNAFWLFNDPLAGKDSIQVTQIVIWFLAAPVVCRMVIQIQIWLLELQYGYSNPKMVIQISKWLFKILSAALRQFARIGYFLK